jgi:hypothetical protein
MLLKMQQVRVVVHAYRRQTQDPHLTDECASEPLGVQRPPIGHCEAQALVRVARPESRLLLSLLRA